MRFLRSMLPDYLATLIIDFVFLFKRFRIDYLPIRVAKVGRRSRILVPHHILGGCYITIGDRVSIGSNSYIHAIDHYAGVSFSPRIIIDDDVYIGRNCYFNGVSTISIGKGCVLSEDVYIADEGHGLDPEMGLIMKQPLTSKGPVLIGEACFIGLRAAILPGVVLGPHCIVGAGSVVTRSFPAHSLVAGNPARLIKSYDAVSKQWIAPPAP